MVGEFIIRRQGSDGSKFTIGVCDDPLCANYERGHLSKLHRVNIDDDLASFTGIMAWLDASEARLPSTGSRTISVEFKNELSAL